MIAAERAGATVRWVDFDPVSGELDPADVAAVVGPRTRVVAVTAASNLIGTMPDVATIARLAHEAGALVVVDAVHYAAHHRVDRAELGADVVLCSPYKFFGPHLGVLAADPAGWRPCTPTSCCRPRTPSRAVRARHAALRAARRHDRRRGRPHRLRGAGRGQPPRAAGPSVAATTAYEETRCRGLEAHLADRLPGLTLRSRAARRTPTLLLEVHDREPRARARGPRRARRLRTGRLLLRAGGVPAPRPRRRGRRADRAGAVHQRRRRRPARRGAAGARCAARA